MVFNTYYVVFLLFFVLCTLCYQFLWIVHFWFPLRYSLTFIYKNRSKLFHCLSRVWQKHMIWFHQMNCYRNGFLVWNWLIICHGHDILGVVSHSSYICRYRNFNKYRKSLFNYYFGSYLNQFHLVMFSLLYQILYNDKSINYSFFVDSYGSNRDHCPIELVL